MKFYHVILEIVQPDSHWVIAPDEEAAKRKAAEHVKAGLQHDPDSDLRDAEVRAISAKESDSLKVVERNGDWFVTLKSDSH